MQELNTRQMRQSTIDKLDELRRMFEAESYQYTHISDWFKSLRARDKRFGNAQLSAWLGRSSYYTQDEYVRLTVTHKVHPSQLDKPIPFAVTPVQESLTVGNVDPSNFGNYTMKQESLPMVERVDMSCRDLIKEIFDAKIAEAREPLVLRVTMDVLQSVGSVINDKIAEVIEYTTKQLNSRTDLVYKDMHTTEDRCIERIQDAINNIDDEKEGSAWDKIAKMVSYKILDALSEHNEHVDKTIAEALVGDLEHNLQAWVDTKLNARMDKKLSESRDGLVAEAVADVLSRIEAARFRLVPGGAS